MRIHGLLGSLLKIGQRCSGGWLLFIDMPEVKNGCGTQICGTFPRLRLESRDSCSGDVQQVALFNVISWKAFDQTILPFLGFSANMWNSRFQDARNSRGRGLEADYQRISSPRT
jgi:hypothetical protein